MLKKFQFIDNNTMEENQNPTTALVSFSPKLQNILDQKIGYGKGQYKLVLPLVCLMICQGAETIAIGMLLPIIKNYWHLTTFQQAIGLTLINIGMPIGSFLQSFSDNYGRKPFVFLNALVYLTFGFLSTISWSFAIFVFLRFICEIGTGMVLPLTGTFTSQIACSQYRATLLARMWILWTVGYIISCILGYIFLIHNQWRIFLLILCLPCLLALILQCFVGRQTIHYLWVRRQTVEAHKVINQICYLNGKQILPLEYIQQQIQSDHFEQNVERIPVKQLFNEKYKGITLRLILIWLSNYFIYYAITLLFPTLIHRIFINHTAGFQYLYLVSLSFLEIIFNLLSPAIMNHPNIGRKKGILYGLIVMFVCAVLSIILSSFSKLTVFILMAVVKAANTVTFAITYIYTAELYQTLLRSKAEGICALLGRSSVALLGIVGLPATKWLNGNGLYLLFAVFAGVGAISTYSMPFCTSNKKA